MLSGPRHRTGIEPDANQGGGLDIACVARTLSLANVLSAGWGCAGYDGARFENRMDAERAALFLWSMSESKVGCMVACARRHDLLRRSA
jgi:hypothetical protein